MPERGLEVGQDFNDLGTAAIPILENPERPGDDWSDPEPLRAPDEPLPYPLEALPAGIRDAVEEVLGFTQAPPRDGSLLCLVLLVDSGAGDCGRETG